MNPELDKQLRDAYPKIFPDRYNGQFGFECGDGWFNLIERLCALVQHTVDRREKEIASVAAWNVDVTAGIVPHWWNVERDGTPAVKPIPAEIVQPVASQVKEKFGSMRFYVSSATDEIYNYIAMAEAMSSVTCEECGAPGKRSGTGWVKVLCDVHTKERNKRRAQ